MAGAKKNVIPDWKHLYQQYVGQLGDLFEYVSTKTREDVSEFIIEFMKSPICKCMDEWHPRYCNDSVIWLHKIAIECFGPLQNSESDYSGYAVNEARWVGMAYGYLHYATSLSSKELLKVYPLEDMRNLYPCLHEVSWANFLTKTVIGFTYEDAEKYLRGYVHYHR